MTNACRCSIYCVTPPYLLKHLAQSPDEKIREVALKHLAIASRVVTKRSLMGLLPASASTGALNRNIFDAQHTSDDDPHGPLIRKEGAPASGQPDVDRAYDGLGWTYRLYRDAFDRNSIDGHGSSLNAFVHVNTDWDNAQWDGRQMLFGDGDNIIFESFTIAIDIIGHELTHGVTQHTSNLRYRNQSGALNESFSDVFGSMVKQFSASTQQTVDNADWLIGAGIFKPGIQGKALRSMADPGSAYNDPLHLGKDPQPKHMSGFVHTTEDAGGVHINSGIPNHAFYKFATNLGGYAWGDAGQIWYETLKALSPESQFQDCADTSYGIAAKYGSKQQTALADAWAAVGIPVNKGPKPKKPKGSGIGPAAAVNGELGKQFDRVIEEMTKFRELLHS